MDRCPGGEEEGAMAAAAIENPSSKVLPTRSAPSSLVRPGRLARAGAMGLLLAALAPPARSATYAYTGTLFTSVANNTTCTIGSCASYTSAMRVTGSFDTAAPLPANLPSGPLTNIAPLVTSYSFTDGVNTIASGDPEARLFDARASTDAVGAIVFARVRVQRWRSGSSPHVVGDRFDDVFVDISGSVAGNNRPCTAVGTSSFSGVADTCTGFGFDTDVSIATAASGGTWSSQLGTAEVPALSTWALALLAAVLAIAAGTRLARGGGG
jgi:hypothetical protein